MGLDEEECPLHGLAYGFLLFGQLRQEVNEDVGDGDAACSRELDAARGNVEEAHLAREEVD